MESLGKLINKRSPINDSNGNRNSYLNNNNNDNSSNKYCLNKNKFTPNTEATQLAEEIATYLNDLNNYASILSAVNKLGINEAKTLFREVQVDINEKSSTRTPVRNPAAYFIWKYKRRIFNRI